MALSGEQKRWIADNAVVALELHRPTTIDCRAPNRITWCDGGG
jgi:hypothetical protein